MMGMMRAIFILPLFVLSASAKASLINNTPAVRSGIWSWACGGASYQGNHPDGYYRRECFDQAFSGKPSWLRGWFEVIYWRDLEIAPGVFNWAGFDANLTKAVDAGLQVQPVIFIFDCATTLPKWLTNYSQPIMFYRKGGTHGPLCAAPDFLDPAFQARWKLTVKALAAHLSGLPTRVRQNVWGVQVVAGITGDNRPWDGVPQNASNAISATDWMAYTRSIADMYIDAFLPTGIPVVANLQGGFSEQQDQGWFLQRAASKGMLGAGVKEGKISHWYNMNGERSVYETDSPLLLTPMSDGSYAHGRGELAVEPDPSQGTYGNWAKSPWWSLQANAEWCLTFGLDVWNLYAGFIGNATFAPTLNFFNRHAGHKTASSAPAAFISFRDSLDTSNVERWPVSEYGPVNSTENPDDYVNETRVLNILSEFSGRGASLGKDAGGALSKDGLKQKKAMDIYDVCWYCFQGNYGRFMKQLEPLRTSVGWWQLGPRNQPWGRFARGLQHSTNRSLIQVQLASDFGSEHEVVQVSIVYFDRGKGNWALNYGDGQVLLVAKKNSMLWQTSSVNVTLKSGSNIFSLSSPNGQDCEFSLMEIIRNDKLASLTTISSSD